MKRSDPGGLFETPSGATECVPALAVAARAGLWFPRSGVGCFPGRGWCRHHPPWEPLPCVPECSAHTPQLWLCPPQHWTLVGDMAPCHGAWDNGTPLMSHSSVLVWILDTGEKRLLLPSSHSVAHRPGGGQLRGPRRLLHRPQAQPWPRLLVAAQCPVLLSASPWSPSPPGAPACPLPGIPSSCCKAISRVSCLTMASPGPVASSDLSCVPLAPTRDRRHPRRCHAHSRIPGPG